MSRTEAVGMHVEAGRHVHACIEVIRRECTRGTSSKRGTSSGGTRAQQETVSTTSHCTIQARRTSPVLPSAERCCRIPDLPALSRPTISIFRPTRSMGSGRFLRKHGHWQQIT